MKRIEKICKNPTINSRFIGEGDFHNEPMIIMAFLPQNNIDKVSTATTKLLQRNNVVSNYEIISINSKITNNPTEYIENARNEARISKKKGVLVLSGRQCSLGVSINNCDIVLLLNNNKSYDMIYQMMFRSMTPGKNKKNGFVVDLNIHRVIETSVMNYASLIKPDDHPRDGIKYLLQERLINLNGDHWMPCFGNHLSKINSLSENIYEIYSYDTEKAINHFLNRLCFKHVLLTKEEQNVFKIMFENTLPTKKQKELIDIIFEEDNKENICKKGIEKIGDDKFTSEKQEQKINYMDILKHIIPLICILTIHDKETSFVKMFQFIENNKYIYNILIDQTKSWWGKSMDSTIMRKFIDIYVKYMNNDKETNQIIRIVKELFMKNIRNNRELSNLIDKYLIPHELEKKHNAEISTPFKFRQEMLDKMPARFWKSKKKVFEPCTGKGGFVIDIIDKFMTGLEKAIPDEKERYRTIVEECLYFGDINSTNIFICKLLIDPYNEYKLNYNEGNTLELNIKTKWNIDYFDAIIGNPPYQPPSNNKKGGKSIWNEFVVYSLQNLKLKGLLLYVHPALWRKPGNKMRDVMFNKQIHYLSIHNDTDGLKNFGATTRIDYYLMENIAPYKKSIVFFEDKQTHKIDINNNLPFIPNSSWTIFSKIMSKLNDNGLCVIRDSDCHTQNTHVSKTKRRVMIMIC